MTPAILSFQEFAQKYCERQQSTPAQLWLTFNAQKATYKPTGWMLLENHMLGSRRCGDLTILPYGPNNSFKAIPDHPVSPRGLASDMSVVVAIMPVENHPATFPQ